MNYRLDKNKNPVLVNDIIEWAKVYEYENRKVRCTEIKKYNVKISTVFLGTDYGFSIRGGHTPVLFETMIFWSEDQELDQFQDRYCLWNQAVEGHREVVRMVIKNIRGQLKENPNKIFNPRKTKDEKLEYLFESIEKLRGLTPKEGTQESEFIKSSISVMDRYKMKKSKNEKT